MTLRTLNPAETPLSGKSLIEASAGTGKTYTIAALYLRLILEKDYNVQQILVVTFTNAATAELRDRLRARLVKAYQLFSLPDPDPEKLEKDDPFLHTLLNKYTDRETARHRLLVAIRNFDECAIYTIHGFCGLMLREAALESGLPFEQEIQNDDSELKQRLADDFWRRCFGAADPTLLALFEYKNINPVSLLKDVEKAVAKPYLEILHNSADAGCDFSLSELAKAFNAAQLEWRTNAAEVSEIFHSHTGLNRSSYNKKNRADWLTWMAGYLSETDPGELGLDKKTPSGFCTRVERFMTSGIAVKADSEPPRHRFFDLWQDFVHAYARFHQCLGNLLDSLRHELIVYLREKQNLEQRKTGVMAPDDILLGLYYALQGDASSELVAQARKRFPVALIDEFQDTDPIQYDIFRQLYGDSSDSVFYVGDPKQAIYGFRGADVFTYLKARNQVDARWTLNTNYRSTDGVVAAVNSLFNGHSRPFWLEDMDYQPVEASDKDHGEISSLTDRMGCFRLLTLESEKPQSKDAAKQIISEFIADDIAALLNHANDENWQLNSRNFNGGDIAILVREHKEGDLLKAALNRRGISCVQASKNSVFETPQAEQLAILLAAVAHGNNEGDIRLALATELLGLDARAIDSLDEDSRQWETWLEKFNRWRHLWLNKGLMVMFRQVLRDQAIYARMLAYPDGERRLTDLLHIAELLNHEALQQSLGMDSLLRWLGRARRRAKEQANPPEENALRLESDENLVNIVTIFASKGLEYDVVYCPFLWSSKNANMNDRPFMFHNPEKDNAPSFELGSERREEWLAAKQAEDFADDLRLLYVAVTRAIQHCTIVTGNINSADGSGLAWLLYGRDVTASSLQDIRATLKQRLHESVIPPGLPDSVLLEPLMEHEQVLRFDARDIEPAGQPRQFRRQLAEPDRITSYTGLTSSNHSEFPDYDFQTQTPDVSGASDEASVLRGAQAGSCLHHILEYLDFSVAVKQQSDLVASALTQFGFSADLSDWVSSWLQNVLDAPLGPDSDFCLANLSQDERLNEMEFYFPVSGLDVGALRRLLHQHFPEPIFQSAIERLDFQSVSGHLKGYIDLIYRHEGRYYLADYKSNWLASDWQDYGKELASQAVANEHYYLQYLIYTVALHRYLTLKVADYDYDSHFGGAQYLFLRGMKPEGKGLTGVYFHKPAIELIEALQDWLT